MKLLKGICYSVVGSVAALVGMCVVLPTVAVAQGGGGSFLDNPSIVGSIDGTDFGADALGSQEVNVPQGTDDADATILDAIKQAINYVLGLLALITLILLIFGGLQMLFSAGDDGGYKKGFTILKNAAIALAFIAFSWLLVSFIFFVLDIVTT